MRLTRVVTCGLIVLLAAAGVSPARAGEILFSIRDGRVTLVARDALLSDILAVWEREGRTRIVAKERVQGKVTSIELTNEPEAAALATILRSVTGYIAARHPVPPRDASAYRCIIINPVPAVFAPPTVLAQSGPVGRTTQQPTQIGMPQSMMGDPGQFPPAFVPPSQDDSEDGGLFRGQMPVGMRQPGMPSPARPAVPPFDTPAGTDPTAVSTQPSRYPGFPGGGVGVPGAIVPAPKPTTTPTLPGQKPPGRPPGVD